MAPLLRKAKTVTGANLVLRNVTVEDAEFILSLRLDPAKSKYLAPTSPRLTDQVAWLRSYESVGDQAYFVICDRVGTALGCVRLYAPIGPSYRWGSWLMVSGLSPLVSIESSLLVYAYGRWLGFSCVRFEVRRGNVAVWKFHERFAGAVRVSESELEYRYEVRAPQIDALLDKYKHLLTDPLAVVPVES